jgi:hypothetical protein
MPRKLASTIEPSGTERTDRLGPTFDPGEQEEFEREIREESGRNGSRGKGWKTVKQEREAAQNGDRLVVKDSEVLVKFLEPEPFGYYHRHWVNKKPYTCPPTGECPLCDLGYDIQMITMFNVVEMKSGDNKYWEAGPGATKKVEELLNSDLTSPIDRDDLYFAINRTKKSNGYYDFALNRIKARDLEEEKNQPALDDTELSSARKKMFTDSIIPHSSKRELRELASELDDD